MAVRAPHLYRSLRCFCLAGFSLLADDVAGGDELPFAFEEHASRGPSSLYEYRPLTRSYVEARAERLSALADAKLAIEDLGREPAAAIYAAAHSGKAGDQPLLRTIVLPLLADVAEACGGFDWSDEAFDRAYAELERSLLGERRTYAAVAPLVGLSLGTQVELADGLRLRVAAAGELAAHWPEANGLLPAGFGSEPDRLCVLELERALLPNEPRAPDAPGELADAVSALRLATAAPVAAGPVLFERLDWRPLAIRPMLPIAATEPPGEPTRLDAFRARLAADLLARLGRAEEDPELAEALDRWELSLFADEPFRSEQLREALSALLGGPDGLWAASVRAAVLLGETAARPRRPARAPARARAGRDGRSRGCRCGAQGGRRDARPRRPRRSRRHARRRARRRPARARPATSPRWPPRAENPPARARRGSTVVPGHGVACERFAPRAPLAADPLIGVVNAKRQALVRAGPLEPEDLHQQVRVDLSPRAGRPVDVLRRAHVAARAVARGERRPSGRVVREPQRDRRGFGPVSTSAATSTKPTNAAIATATPIPIQSLTPRVNTKPGVLGRGLQVREGIAPGPAELLRPAAALWRRFCLTAYTRLSRPIRLRSSDASTSAAMSSTCSRPSESRARA